MNITNEEGSLEHYAIISYSHADSDTVKSELREFDNHGVCYWYDERMTGGENYEVRWRKMLDQNNCKGVVFFISDTFLLSGPCAEEMRYFRDKYGVENPNKFCLFILPVDYPYNNEDNISDKVCQYVNGMENAEARAEAQKKLLKLEEHIRLFWELNNGGKLNYAITGNEDNYIDNYCNDEDGLFHKFGIIYGHNRVSNVQFGFFPQKQEADDDENGESRKFDKKPAYYAPIEWLVIKDNAQTQTLLSRDLLFAVDYLGLKYPFEKADKAPNKTLTDQIKDNFMKYFKPDNDKSKIKNIRFLSEKELQIQLMKCREDLEKKHEILLPKATFFAQTSDKKDAPAFWLAGDMDDARWVDAATEGLSEQKAGVELYYVRIVIEVEK